MKVFRIILMGSVWICASCSYSTEMGANFLGESALNIFYADTLTLNTSSVIFDSIQTANGTRLLVGSNHDENLGNVYSVAYFQLTRPTERMLNSEYDLDQGEVQFETLSLHLEFDDYTYYDTVSSMTLSVHQLTEELSLQDGSLYNTTDFDYSPSPIGSISFVPRTHQMDTLEIPLSNTIGSDLFKKLIDEDTRVTSADEFREYFKGLALVPNTNATSCFVGFKPSASLRIYYIDNTTIPAKRTYLTFPIGSYYFNNIQSDRTQTNVKDLSTLEYGIPSSKTDNLSFVQSGVGISTRIEIPYLRDFVLVNPNMIILSAQLEIYPQEASYLNNQPFLQTLGLFKVNGANQTLVEYESDFDAFLIEDIQLGRDTYYVADVTAFIKDQISTLENNHNALLIRPKDTSLFSEINRLYLRDGTQYPGMRLKIFYVLAD